MNVVTPMMSASSNWPDSHALMRRPMRTSVRCRTARTSGG